MQRKRTLTLLNAFFFLLAFLISTASQFKFFAGKDIGQVSNKYDTVFAPAGITFSVWSIIYLSLFGFCIYHIIQAFKKNANDEASWEIRQIDILFIVNNIAAAGWVLAWLHDHLFLSVVLMLIQLLTLISVNLQLDIYDRHKSLASKIFTQFPLSIYFAWICIATIANVSALLVKVKWNGWGIPANDWTMILIAVATVLTITVILTRRNVFFGLIVIWAFYGIVLKRTAVDAVVFQNVILSAWVGIALIAVVEVMQLIRNRKSDSFL